MARIIKTWLSDAGHGGPDPGAVFGKLIEKVMNLVVALEFGRVMELNGQRVIYTRKTDVFIDIPERAAIGVKNNVDYALSFHFNACSGKGDGSEAIHSVYSDQGDELAMAILKGMQTRMGQNIRGMHTKASSKGSDYFGFIRGLAKKCKGVAILEPGFIDNQTDNKLFDEVEEWKKIGRIAASESLKFIGWKEDEIVYFAKN